MPVSAALAAGAMVVLVVAALAGASLDGQAWWAVVAGAFASASGMVLGSTRRAAPAAGLGLVAVVAVAVAAGVSDEGPAAAPSVRHEIVWPDDRVRPPAVAPPPNERDRRRGPEALVRSYYAALDAHEYAAAWRRLSPSVQAVFGGFDSWRRGYATTLGHRLEDLQVAGETVRLVLVATDRTPCGGSTEQRFSVQWRLERRKAVALAAVKLGGLDPASACG